MNRPDGYKPYYGGEQGHVQWHTTIKIYLSLAYRWPNGQPGTARLGTVKVAGHVVPTHWLSYQLKHGLKVP